MHNKRGCIPQSLVEALRYCVWQLPGYVPGLLLVASSQHIEVPLNLWGPWLWFGLRVDSQCLGSMGVMLVRWCRGILRVLSLGGMEQVTETEAEVVK